LSGIVIEIQPGVDWGILSQLEAIIEGFSEALVEVCDNSVGCALCVLALSISASCANREFVELVELTEGEVSVSHVAFVTMDGSVGAVTVGTVSR
jgi:hypothetical protein